MPKFDLSVPHTLGKEAATERLQGFSDKLQEKYSDQLSDLQQTWQGDRLDFAFTTYGIQIKGGLTVTDSAIDVDGDLPFTAAMFKGKITEAIEDQLKRLVS